MRFFHDSDQLTTVVWYFTDAPFIPFAHCFGSGQWWGEGEPVSDLGEQYNRPTTWANGHQVGTAPGNHVCGTQEAWTHGVSIALADTAPRNVDGTLLCCYGDHVPFVGVGGVLADGSAIFGDNIFVGYGGVLVDGSAIAGGGVFYSRGGVLADGSSPQGSALLNDAGGVVANGTGPQSGRLMFGAGGVVLDSSAPQGTGGVWTSTGGVLAGGFAGLPVPSIGGVLVGGNASLQGKYSILTSYNKYDFDINQLGTGATLGVVVTASIANGGSVSKIFGVNGTFWCIRCSTGTTSAAGAAGAQNLGADGASGQNVTTNTSWTFAWKVYLENLGTSGERFKARVGIMDTVIGTIGEGVWFEYADNVNGGQWVLNTKKTSGGAGSSSSNTTNAPVANTPQELMITITGTSAEFFIDGVSQGTIATNVPTAVVFPCIDIIKSVGTAGRRICADYLSTLVVF